MLYDYNDNDNERRVGAYSRVALIRDIKVLLL